VRPSAGSSKLFSSRIRAALSVVAVVVVGGLVASAPATAAPTPSAVELERKISALQQQIPVTDEQLNQAKIAAQQSGARKAQLTRQKADLDKRYAALRAVVDEYISQAYKGSGMAGWAALMQSGSLQTYSDQAATLGYLSTDNQAQLKDYITTKQQLDTQSAQLDQTIAQQAKAQQDLAAKDKEIRKQIADFRAMRARLGDRASRSDARTGITSGGSDTTQTPTGNISARRQSVVDFAYAQLGKPYVFAADGPSSYDCSGLTMAAYAKVGVSIPHSAHQQQNQLASVSKSALQPGDLVFFYSDTSHVGIYVGGGMVIHAPTEGENVKKASMSAMPFNGGGRLP
jgi:cell wall-associated NlpC family hydrolase